MAYNERKAIYEKIEQKRDHPLVCYATSARPNATARIAGDAIREFVDQLHKLPADVQAIDLIINSNGGDGLASWRLICMVREKLGKDGKLAVLVPHYAFSAATLIALGADSIYMHPLACLGPIDPQITITTKDGNHGFAYEDVVAFAEFLKEEGKITEQGQLTPLLDHLVKEIRPSVLGASKRSSSQSVTMAKRLLRMHMTGVDASKADGIAEKLNKSFFNHGHAVPRTEAIELGLKIDDSDNELDGLLWELFEDIEKEMEMRTPFNALAQCLANPTNAFLMNAPTVLNVPANTPPQFLQQVWTQHLQNNVATQQCTPIDYELIQAIVESPRHKSRFATKGKIFAARKPDMDYIVGAPQTYARWE